MIPGLLVDVVNVQRRADYTTAPRDVLNNPSYGNPADWDTIYTNIKVRISFSGKPMDVTDKGELIRPEGTLYFSKQYFLYPMDRIITVACPGSPSGIEYVVTQVVPSFYAAGMLDHYEGLLSLPVGS